MLTAIESRSVSTDFGEISNVQTDYQAGSRKVPTDAREGANSTMEIQRSAETKGKVQE